MFELMKEKMKRIVTDKNLGGMPISINARVLSPEEAIGNPFHSDYPILKGKERMVEARFMHSRGVAFSDMFGDYSTTLEEVLTMELKNNFRRAIFTASVNAVLRELGLVDRTEHCKDSELLECASMVCDYITRYVGRDDCVGGGLKRGGHKPRVFLCGLQPRFAERLTEHFETKITDMDKDNLGKVWNDVMVEGVEKTEEYIDWCDIVFATGSTFVNDTAREILRIADSKRKVVIFYGVTVSGPAYLLGLNRYCPCGE